MLRLRHRLLAWALLLGIAAGSGARATVDRTALGGLPIPNECLEIYHQGALLFASTLGLSPEARVELWAAQMAKWSNGCELYGMQGLLANQLELERNLVVTYWLDRDAARDDGPEIQENIALEAKARMAEMGLEPEDLDGRLAYGGPVFQHHFTGIVRYWKNAALSSGKALVFGRFVFTSGGDQNHGYTLYDFVRDENGALVLDTKGEPTKTTGSYGREVTRVYDWAKRVVDEYDQDIASQGFLDRAIGFNDSFIWTWFVGKTAKEIRESGYPEQVESYLRMAEGLNLAGSKRQVFVDLYQHLLDNQQASLARDAQVLDEMKMGIVAGAALAPLILTCGAGVAASLPALSLSSSDGIALVAAATATVWVARTSYLTYQQQEMDRLSGQDFKWSGLLDEALEAGLTTLPIADLVPVGCLTLSEGARFLIDGVGAARALPGTLKWAASNGVGRTFWQWLKLGYSKDPAVWGAIWRQSLLYVGTDTVGRQILPGQRPLIRLDNGFALDWNVLAFQTQQVVKNLLTPIVINQDSQAARFFLNNAVSLVASFFSEAAVNGHLIRKDAAFDLSYADGVSFWAQEGNRALLKATEQGNWNVGRSELVLMSLQMLKSMTVDTTLKNYLRARMNREPGFPMTEVKAFLRNSYGLDYSRISDQDLEQGVREFLAASDESGITAQQATLPDAE